jgi:hypothetical protein
MPKRLLRTAVVVAAVAACVSVGRPVLAILGGRFRNVDEMVAADNLLIVRVPPDVVEPVPGIDNVRDYEVEVLSLLRMLQLDEPPHDADRDFGSGPPDGKPRRVAVSTTTELKRGTRYLLTGKRALRDGKPWLLFHWDLGVIEIPDHFRLSAFRGRTIRQKVAAILLARRAAVQHEMEALRKEKKLLDGSAGTRTGLPAW